MYAVLQKKSILLRYKFEYNLSMLPVVSHYFFRVLSLSQHCYLITRNAVYNDSAVRLSVHRLSCAVTRGTQNTFNSSYCSIIKVQPGQNKMEKCLSNNFIWNTGNKKFVTVRILGKKCRTCTYSCNIY